MYTLLKLKQGLNCYAGTKMLFSANALAALASLLPPIILTTPTNFSSRKIKETAAKNSRKEEEEALVQLLLHFDQTNRVIMHLLYSTSSMYVRGMFSQRAKHTFD